MRKTLLSALAAALLAVPALAADLPLDTPLVTDPPLKVDAGDFDAALTRVPPDKRAEFRTSYDRVAGMIDNVYVARVLAAKARAEGLDKDPIVQRKLVQAQEAVLADLYLQHFDKQTQALNLDARAKELYEADRSKYKKPAAVHLQHLLVDLKGRTPEMAQLRAQKAYDEAKAGASFADLVVKYSDDSAGVPQGGDVGWVAVSQVPSTVAPEVAKLQKPGDVTPPIRTENGYEIVRLVERRNEEPMTFEEAKKVIVAGEQARLERERREELVRSIRSSKTVVVDTKNVEALVIPVEKSLSSAQAAPAKADSPAK
jgi:peptidyl-prolyl cis-trans isomerase C